MNPKYKKHNEGDKMELVKGRPGDLTGRLDKEIKVYDLLDELGIEYERTDHEEA